MKKNFKSQRFNILYDKVCLLIKFHILHTMMLFINYNSYSKTIYHYFVILHILNGYYPERDLWRTDNDRYIFRLYSVSSDSINLIALCNCRISLIFKISRIHFLYYISCFSCFGFVCHSYVRGLCGSSFVKFLFFFKFYCTHVINK